MIINRKEETGETGKGKGEKRFLTEEEPKREGRRARVLYWSCSFLQEKKGSVCFEEAKGNFDLGALGIDFSRHVLIITVIKYENGKRNDGNSGEWCVFLLSYGEV